ncbi:ABC transporter substrate-binding protein [Fodinicurvata fenggangensis]|uniref:ABC transporter substrate-binding protein n=1 Tax=Fodinicurvata fenggangensis TaxID=1121830 RepID=UPI00047EF352|nr:ABC transporter substrate-binding protein [Fodinicurvata fenggangensis]
MKFKSTLALAVGAAIAFSAPPTVAQENKTLKVGALVTLSGAGASWGRGMLEATELAASKYNEAGGIEVGGETYDIEVIAYDDSYKANEAVSAANRLVYDDEVKYIIGTVGSAPILAIQPITEKEGVITMTLGFTSEALSPEKPYTFRPNLTTAEVAQPQIDWVVESQGIETVGALFPNDETGEQIAKDVSASYERAGAEMSAIEFFERDQVDFVPLLTRIMSEGVDAIELDGNSPETAGQIVQQARDIGFEGAIIRTGGPATAEIVNVAGAEAAEGMFVHAGLDPSKDSVNAYITEYEETFEHSMNGFSPFFYDGANMLFQAMQEAGTVEDTDAVRKALESIESYEGVLGELSWTGEDRYGIAHQIDAPFYVAQVRDGKEEIVATCDIEGCE